MRGQRATVVRTAGAMTNGGENGRKGAAMRGQSPAMRGQSPAMEGAAVQVAGVSHLLAVRLRQMRDRMGREAQQDNWEQGDGGAEGLGLRCGDIIGDGEAQGKKVRGDGEDGAPRQRLGRQRTVEITRRTRMALGGRQLQGYGRS